MSRIRFVALFVLGFAVMLCGAVPAQDGFRRYSPDRFERATKVDDAGMIQWAKHDPGKCPTCAGVGKTKCKVCERFADDSKTCPDCKRKKDRQVVCRTCIGTGGMPDPLEKVQCPACSAAGFLICTVCSGGGHLRVNKAKRWSACPACRGTGAFKCGTCDGKRHVGTAGLKPSLAEAQIKHLKKALATTEKVLAGVSKFEAKGGTKVRKEVKALAKLIKDAQSVYPSFKKSQKVLTGYMSKIYAGSSFLGHEEHEAYALNSFKAGVEYYLEHQKRMLGLALKRAEANAKIAAEKKGK